MVKCKMPSGWTEAQVRTAMSYHAHVQMVKREITFEMVTKAMNGRRKQITDHKAVTTQQVVCMAFIGRRLLRVVYAPWDNLIVTVEWHDHD